MKRLRLLFFTFLFSTFSIPCVFADTVVTADITPNTTWTLANSPYVVSSVVTVATSTTLAVESGVTVRFGTGAGLFVSGKILATGTASSTITFTSATTTNPQPGDWSGIYFYNSTGSVLSHSFITYADNAVTLENSGVTISKSDISQSAHVGITVFDNSLASSTVVTDSNIHNNTYGFIAHNVSMSVNNNTIANNTVGAVFWQPIRNNEFDFVSNYWGSVTGPWSPMLNHFGQGNNVSGDALIIPFLETTPTVGPESADPVVCCSNVLFLPGFEASKLYE